MFQEASMRLFVLMMMAFSLFLAGPFALAAWVTGLLNLHKGRTKRLPRGLVWFTGALLLLPLANQAINLVMMANDSWHVERSIRVENVSCALLVAASAAFAVLAVFRAARDRTLNRPSFEVQSLAVMAMVPAVSDRVRGSLTVMYGSLLLLCIDGLLICLLISVISN